MYEVFFIFFFKNYCGINYSTTYFKREYVLLKVHVGKGAWAPGLNHRQIKPRKEELQI